MLPCLTFDLPVGMLPGILAERWIIISSTNMKQVTTKSAVLVQPPDDTGQRLEGNKELDVLCNLRKLQPDRRFHTRRPVFRSLQNMMPAAKVKNIFQSCRRMHNTHGT